jgi:hypothetical protein
MTAAFTPETRMGGNQSLLQEKGIKETCIILIIAQNIAETAHSAVRALSGEDTFEIIE